MNLEERLRDALASLEGIKDDPSEYRNKDRERINGKIEGVKLALSYLEDEKKLDDDYFAAMRCGDWPAPCNCDDPKTHNGR